MAGTVSQNKIYLNIKRTISLIVLIAFFTSFTVQDARSANEVDDVILASSPEVSAKKIDVARFTIPRSLGEIKQTFQGNSDRVVIHIQDAHWDTFG